MQDIEVPDSPGESDQALILRTAAGDREAFAALYRRHQGAVYRYLLGMHLLDTGGSILAAGIQHASWNAAQNLNVVEGGDWKWQTLAAVALLTALVAIGRRLWRPELRPVSTVQKSIHER